MLRNMGTTERIIRSFLGAGIVAAGVYFDSWLGLLGVLLLIGAAVAICPAYHLFGIRKSQTCAPAGESGEPIP